MKVRSRIRHLRRRVSKSWVLPLGILFLVLLNMYRHAQYATEKTVTSLKKTDPTGIPDTVSKYISWHARNRPCFESTSSCYEDRPPSLVWQCPSGDIVACAGVGDRFRGIQVALALAIATDRMFFLNWPDDPVPLTTAVVPGTIDWQLPSTLKPSELPTLDWFFCHPPRPCRPGGHIPDNEHLPNVDASQPDINLHTDDLVAKLARDRDIAISVRIPSQTAVKLFRNPHFNVRFAELAAYRIPAWSLARVFMNALFRPAPAVRVVIDRVLSAGFIPGEYTSVHARTGYDVGETTDNRFRYVNAHVASSAAELYTCTLKVLSSTKKMFLATDSVLFKQEFIKFAARDGVQLNYIDERAFHFGRADRSANRVEEREKAIHAFVNVFADLFLLSGGRAIITTGSGFASAAYMLGNASHLHVAKSGNGTAHCMPLG